MFSVFFHVHLRRRDDFCFSHQNQRQRRYTPGKIYWMTFLWPSPKFTTVALINKNLLVCTIKWEPLIQSLHNFDPSSHAYTLISFWRNSVGKPFFANFLLKNWMWTLYWTYLRDGWCETKRKCISWILGELCDHDLWPHPWPWSRFFKGQILE